MPLILLGLSLVAIIAVVVGMGYVILRAVRSPVGKHDARLFVAGALGLLFTSWLAALAGMTVGWDPGLWFVVGICLVVGALGIRTAARDAKDFALDVRTWWRDATLLERAFPLFGLAVLAGLLVHTALPPVFGFGDDAMHFLRQPQLLLRDGYLRGQPDDTMTYYTMNRQVLSTLGMFLWDDRLARVFGLVATWLLTSCLIVLMARLVHYRAGMLSVFMLMYPAIITIQAPSARFEPLYGLFVIAALLILEEASSRGTWNSSLFVVGLLFGGAVGTKVTAIWFLPLLALWAAHAYFTAPKAVRPSAAQLAGIAGLGILGVTVGYLPWLVRGGIEFGNPLFPFLPADVPAPVLPNNLPSLAEYPVGQRLYRAVLAPILLTLSRSPEIDRRLPALLWALAGVAVIFYRGQSWRWWLLAGALIVFPWQPLVHPIGLNSRYMFPGVVLLVGLAASGLSAVLSSGWRVVRWGVGGALGLVLAITMASQTMVGFTSLAVASGFKSREEFMAKNVAPYEVIRWGRDHLTWDDRVLALGVSEYYYFDTHMLHGTLSEVGYAFSHSHRRPDESCFLADSLGINYVIMSRGMGYFKLEKYGKTRHFESLVRGCLDTAFVSSDSTYVVYRVRPPHPAGLREDLH